MASQSIEIRNLYKIFGPRGGDYHRSRQKAACRKPSSTSEHGHVLGLKDINISIPGGQHHRHYGAFRVRQVDADPPHQPSDRPDSGRSALWQYRHLQDAAKRNSASSAAAGRRWCSRSSACCRIATCCRTPSTDWKYRGVPKGEREERANIWIKRVGLDGFAGHYPNQLSGGMQQRVGLARALTNDAEILLMDEAYSALDPLIRVDMQSVLLDLQKELKKTVVFITHDLDEALRLGDKVAILRDGELIQQGSAADIVLNPANDYIEAFVKEVNRSRVIPIEALMEPLSNPAIDTVIRIPGKATVEEGMRMMTESNVTHATVTGADGLPAGRVSLEGLVRCLVGTGH